jgi:hypothetical protein
MDNYIKMVKKYIKDNGKILNLLKLNMILLHQKKEKHYRVKLI